MKHSTKFIEGAIGLMIVCFVLLFNSCKTIKEIPVEVEKVVEKIEYRDRIQTDSIYQRDSIFVDVKGDTIIKVLDHYYYRDRYLHDTINTAVHDTIFKETVKQVEKDLTFYESVKMQVGGVAIPIIAILACVGIGMAVKKIV